MGDPEQGLSGLKRRDANWAVSLGIALDGRGNAHITGRTFSTDWPLVSAAQEWPGDFDYNAFVAKISVPEPSRALGEVSSLLGLVALAAARRRTRQPGTSDA